MKSAPATQPAAASPFASPCRAMVLERPGGPLVSRLRPMPVPRGREVLIEVSACGVCRTDLHLLDGELPDIRYPIVPGHQIVGRIVLAGREVEGLSPGQRVGVPWLGHTCGVCAHCLRERENLCDAARFTGYQIDGGYSSHCLADSRYVFPLADGFSDLEVAPLLCAGLIGYRSLRLCGDARSIGIYGFGAAAHIITQLALWQGRSIFAFTRSGDSQAQAFARSLGAVWAGASGQPPPQVLDAAIIFAAAGELVPAALKAVGKGGSVVCGGIHMSDIPAFPYASLWGERCLRSVANLTRRDAEEFLGLAPQVPIRTQVHVYPLEQANTALADLRAGRFTGCAVLDARRTGV